jgi:spore coat protein U-like protein
MAELLEGCSVGTTPVAFADYKSPAGPTVNAVGDIAVTCQKVPGGPISYTISFSTGSSGIYSERRLFFQTHYIIYNLYQNPPRNIIWGNGTFGSQSLSDSKSFGVLPTTQHYPVYARIPSLQNVPAGTYTDTIIVTLTY